MFFRKKKNEQLDRIESKLDQLLEKNELLPITVQDDESQYEEERELAIARFKR
jgi:hypothetical protein